MKGHLDLLLLATLAESPAHGYLVVERLKRRSGGALALGEGTVYPALYRLEGSGLVASAWSSASGRRRRVYRLTRRGRAALERGRAEWTTFAGVVQAVLG